MLLTATLASLAALCAPGPSWGTPNTQLATLTATPTSLQERGWIGIALESREDVEGDPRVVVGSVAAGSPAETAGLKAGDVILTVGGAPLAGVQDLSTALAQSRPGQRLALDVLRRFDVKLGNREGSGSGWLGVSIDDGRSIEMQGQAGTAVRLTTVNDAAPAAAAGLRANDQLVAINGQVVRGSDALIDDIGSRAPGERISLDVSRKIEVVLGRRDGALEPDESAGAPGEEEEEHEHLEGHDSGHDSGHESNATESRPAREPRQPREAREPRQAREPRAPSRAAPSPTESSRGYLGIYLENEGEGAVIADAVERGPAGEAGLMPGDVVVSIDGDEVGSTEDLIATLRQTAPGQKIEIVVRRGDQVEQRTVTLGEGPAVFAEPAEAPLPGRLFQGLRPSGELDAEIRERMESMLGEWRSSQSEFGDRWSKLMEDARKRGQDRAVPGLEALSDLGQGRWFQFSPGAAVRTDDGAAQEREELRKEMRALREELRGLREQLAGLKDTLAR